MIALIDSMHQKLYRSLHEGKSIWVLYLDIVKFQEVEFSYSYHTCQQILEEIEQEIKTTLPDQRNIFLYTKFESRGGDDFVVYFVTEQSIKPLSITDLIENWVRMLEDGLNNRITRLVKDRIKLRSGLAECKGQNNNRSADYILYAAVKEAFLINKSEPDPHFFIKRNEINSILNNPDHFLHTAYQPIIETKSGNIFGFEALARVSDPTSFGTIADLFPFAEKVGQLYPIEKLCRRKAIQSYPTIWRGKEILFLNINPKVLADPDFSSGQTRKLLVEQGLHPSDVVLEITEQSAIEDFVNFRAALDYYRKQGFQIALDDVGSGYSSLQSIAELQPDFLKIDRSLISGVNADPIKWALLETFATFSKRIGCRIIAEGVETLEEMQTVVQLGVDYIQGYFVAKPDFVRPVLNPNAVEMLNTKIRLRSRYDNAIVSLIEKLELFDHTTKVNVVESFFRNHPNHWLVGIIEDERLVGIVQRDKLFAHLGTLYGVALFVERNISQIMDKNPLLVEYTTPIEVVSKIATQRPSSQLYDGIVVVNKGKPVGIVTVVTLMKAMADYQIQIALGASPLTGLPGNMVIEREIRLRLESNHCFGIMYIDFNNFKHYNDLHGFGQGDLVINLMAQLLLEEANSIETETFIGHIGGDDFIALMPTHELHTYALSIARRFEKETAHFVGAEDISVALAGLCVDPNKKLTAIQIAQMAAQVKKEVKAMGGTTFLCR